MQDNHTILINSDLLLESNMWAFEVSAQIALAKASAVWRRELSRKYRIVKNEHHWLSINHEAAHAVIALCAELVVEEVSIDTQSIFYGGSTSQALKSNDQMMMRDKNHAGIISLKMIMMAMAGPIYENLISQRYVALHEKDDDDADLNLWRGYLEKSFPNLNLRQLIMVELAIADFVQKMLMHKHVQKMIRSLVVALLKKKNLSLGESEMETFRRKHLSSIMGMHGMYIRRFSYSFFGKTAKMQSGFDKKGVRTI